MALKDWKKKKLFWINLKKEEAISLDTSLLGGYNIISSKGWKKSFATKSQALKFAKSYMSKN